MLLLLIARQALLADLCNLLLRGGGQHSTCRGCRRTGHHHLSVPRLQSSRLARSLAEPWEAWNRGQHARQQRNWEMRTAAATPRIPAPPPAAQAACLSSGWLGRRSMQHQLQHQQQQTAI